MTASKFSPKTRHRKRDWWPALMLSFCLIAIWWIEKLQCGPEACFRLTKEKQPLSWFKRSTHKGERERLAIWINASGATALAPGSLSQPAAAAKPASTQFLIYDFCICSRGAIKGDCNNSSRTKEYTFKKAKTTTRSWACRATSCCLTSKGIKSFRVARPRI